MSEKSKGVVVDVNYVTQEIEELMKHPIVQKVIYLQQVLKNSENKEEDKSVDSSIEGTKPLKKV